MFTKFINKWKQQDEDTFHFRVSAVKSGGRIVAGIMLIIGFPLLAGIALIAAEILGIVEEL